MQDSRDFSILKFSSYLSSLCMSVLQPKVPSALEAMALPLEGSEWLSVLNLNRHFSFISLHMYFFYSGHQFSVFLCSFPNPPPFCGFSLLQ